MSSWSDWSEQPEPDIWYRSFDPRELDPTEAGESYLPTLTNIREINVRRARYPASPLAVQHAHTCIELAEAREAEGEADGSFLVGMAYGIALSTPLWLLLAGVALWLGQR